MDYLPGLSALLNGPFTIAVHAVPVVILKDAQSRIVAAEDKLTAVEFRAQAAELEAREAKQALALVEEAIRRRLLCASPEAAGQLSAVA